MPRPDPSTAGDAAALPALAERGQFADTRRMPAAHYARPDRVATVRRLAGESHECRP
jgi:hypothetical protein